MKVVQINAVYPNGSTGTICEEISDFLIRTGNDSLVLFSCCKNDLNRPKNAIPLSCHLLIKINALLSRVTGITAHGNILSTLKALYNIQKFNPDIVHLHNIHGNYINIKILLSYLSKRKMAVVITLHDCWFYTGKCTHYTSIGCEKWKKGCKCCPKLKDDIPSYFFDKTNKVWKERKRLLEKIEKLGVIGVSDWITNQAKLSLFPKHTRFTRIYNWIDSSVYYPKILDNSFVIRKYKIPQKSFYISCVSASWAVGSERLNDLVRLSNMLDEDVCILMAGSIDESILLPPNIVRLGYISDPEDLANIYRFSNVYVHLSREDTFGKVIAEAMACGTPIIAYDETACPEIIGKDCGYICPAGDVQKIILSINILRKNGDFFESKKCVKFSSCHFNRQDRLFDIIQFYKKISS